MSDPVESRSGKVTHAFRGSPPSVRQETLAAVGPACVSLADAFPSVAAVDSFLERRPMYVRRVVEVTPGSFELHTLPHTQQSGPGGLAGTSRRSPSAIAP